MAVACLMLTSPGHTAEERYEYDPAGRLSRIVADGGSRITRFTYDALGNLVSVRAIRQAFPPIVLSVHPEAVRAGNREVVRVIGASLAGASVTPPKALFEITDLITSPSALSFLLAVPVGAPLGNQTFRVRNADGEALFALDVLPRLPSLSVSPLPLALPTDGSIRRFLVRLSHVDVLDRTVSLSLSDPSIAALDTGEVTIAAGDTETPALIRGMKGGVSVLRLASEGLEPRAYSVYVTADYGGVNSQYSAPVGVAVGESQGPMGSSHPLWSDVLGLVVGPYLDAVAPAALAVGVDEVPLTVYGSGLAAVDRVSIEPAEGIVLSEPTGAPDGGSVSVVASVAADAALGLRRVTLGGGDGPYRPAAPHADLINITPPRPALESVAPNYGVRGSRGLGIAIRGHNLGQATSVAFIPPDGILVGSDPRAGTDGTQLDLVASIAADAPMGDRIVTVTTPAGSSSAVASPANRFRVVNAVRADYQPLASALLGVRVGTGGVGSVDLGSWSPGLGLMVGPGADALSPDHAERGASFSLLVTGVGLDTVTEARFEPAAGVSINGVTPEAGGTIVSLRTEIAPDAAETWRRLRLFAGTREVPFADARASLFLVTGRVPEIFAVSPNTLEIGAGPKTVTLLGRNLDRATAVNAVPPQGLVLGGPAAASGYQLTVPIEAQGSAAPGSRVLTVTTPAGTSAPTPSPSNILYLYQRALAVADPLPAPLVGVSVGGIAGGEYAIEPLVSPTVGILVGEGEAGATGNRVNGLAAPLLGVAVGGYAVDVEAPPLVAGGTYTLAVRGSALDRADGAGAYPGLDLAVGTPVSDADGTRTLLSFTVPPGAVVEPRELRLVAGDDPIPFVDPAKALLWVAPGVPQIESVSPIVLRPGETGELTIRGRHLQNARRVVVEPAGGVVLSSTLGVDDDGGEVRIRIHAEEGASRGTRTIRVETPGGMSADRASPANSLTLY